MNSDPLKKIFEFIKQNSNLLSLPAGERAKMLELLYEIKKTAEGKDASEILVYSRFLRFIDIITRNLTSPSDDRISVSTQPWA